MSYQVHDGAQHLVAASADEIIDAALHILSERLQHSESISCPQDVWQFAALKLGPLEREVCACMFLDNRHQMIEYNELFLGTVNQASVYPREIVKRALTLNASTLVLLHNHTSGSCEPSEPDKTITKRVQAALALIDITLLDHVVVGGGTYVSFAERGWL